MRILGWRVPRVTCTACPRAAGPLPAVAAAAVQIRSKQLSHQSPWSHPSPPRKPQQPPPHCRPSPSGRQKARPAGPAGHGHATGCHGNGSVGENGQQSLPSSYGVATAPSQRCSMWHSLAPTATRSPFSPQTPRGHWDGSRSKEEGEGKGRKKRRKGGEKMEEEEKEGGPPECKTRGKVDL